VENCGSKFHGTGVFFPQAFGPQLLSVSDITTLHLGSFADGQLTDALKHLATDYATDPKVRKKVLAVLASWSRQFKDESSAAGIAGLYRQVKPASSEKRWLSANVRARRGEKIRKRSSGRLKRNVLRKPEARRLLPELLHLENNSALNRSVFSRGTCLYVLIRILIYRRSLRFSPLSQTRHLPQIT